MSAEALEGLRSAIVDCHKAISDTLAASAAAHLAISALVSELSVKGLVDCEAVGRRMRELNASIPNLPIEMDDAVHALASQIEAAGSPPDEPPRPARTKPTLVT